MSSVSKAWLTIRILVHLRTAQCLDLCSPGPNQVPTSDDRFDTLVFAERADDKGHIDAR